MSNCRDLHSSAFELTESVIVEQNSISLNLPWCCYRMNEVIFRFVVVVDRHSGVREYVRVVLPSASAEEHYLYPNNLYYISTNYYSLQV